MEVKLVADIAEEPRWDGPGGHIYEYRISNEPNVCYLADTPLKMKSTDSSRIPADS